MSSLSNLTLDKAIKFATDAKYREFHRLLKMEGHSGTTTLIDGGRLTFHDGLACARQHLVIFKQGLYAIDGIGDAPTILDVGANIGMASLYLMQRFPKAKITAFEPDPRLAAIFRKNMEAFGYCVHLDEAAAGTSAAIMGFQPDSGDGGRLSDTGTDHVKVIRLKEYLYQPVDLLKVDIEGAEFDVLMDCRDDLSIVRNLFVEYHSMVSQPQQLPELLTMLRDAGFRLQIQTDHCAVSPFLGSEISSGMDLRLNIFATR
jgi:FkbM family methyltransferase